MDDDSWAVDGNKCQVSFLLAPPGNWLNRKPKVFKSWPYIPNCILDKVSISNKTTDAKVPRSWIVRKCRPSVHGKLRSQLLCFCLSVLSAVGISQEGGCEANFWACDPESLVGGIQWNWLQSSFQLVFPFSLPHLPPINICFQLQPKVLPHCPCCWTGFGNYCSLCSVAIHITLSAGSELDLSTSHLLPAGACCHIFSWTKVQMSSCWKDWKYEGGRQFGCLTGQSPRALHTNSGLHGDINASTSIGQRAACIRPLMTSAGAFKGVAERTGTAALVKQHQAPNLFLSQQIEKQRRVISKCACRQPAPESSPIQAEIQNNPDWWAIFWALWVALDHEILLPVSVLGPCWESDW